VTISEARPVQKYDPAGNRDIDPAGNRDIRARDHATEFVHPTPFNASPRAYAWASVG
jgi:hypothetical protein